MPTGLGSRAKTAWKQLVSELDALNLVTVVDGYALEGAVVALDHARTADRAVERIQEEIGNLERSGAGSQGLQHLYYRLSMQNAASKKGWQQYKGFCVEFGLTPASRTRLAVGDTGVVIDAAEVLVS
jgi:P27 family predicted phage terminase small subunit